VLFYSWADVIGYERFLDEIEDPEVREETKRKTTELFRLVDRGGCRHQALVRYFDEAIEPCGDACDTCRGETIETLVGPAAAFVKSRSRRAGAAAMSPALGAGLSPALAAATSPASALLFERLRAVRKRLADAEGVPAYIVFSDAVLRGLAERKPRTPREMLLVSGIGPVKLERYGAAFLEALAGEVE
jgi:ATP-dependent DNA helicase RecQ